MKTLLITGSAGYIGSVVCKLAKEKGYKVIAVDLERHKHNYYDVKIDGMCCSDPKVAMVAVDYKVDAVFHLAASANITDSLTRPLLYYQNNTGATAKMFDNLIMLGWRGNIVFSSTAAAYEVSGGPVVETDPTGPINAYGRSKLMCEQLLYEVYKAHQIPVTVFRYFNVAGAYGDVGDHKDSHHVLQKLCSAMQLNREFYVCGTDYDTPDGTCVRDYIHVLDIAAAHFHALNHHTSPSYDLYNLGTYHGVSVKELADKFQATVGGQLKVVDTVRRPGDQAFMVANPEKFTRTGFKFKHSTMEEIICSAWKHYRS